MDGRGTREALGTLFTPTDDPPPLTFQWRTAEVRASRSHNTIYKPTMVYNLLHPLAYEGFRGSRPHHQALAMADQIVDGS